MEWHARPGDRVVEGEPLLTLHTDEPDRFERALASLEDSFEVGESFDGRELILDRIAASGQ